MSGKLYQIQNGQKVDVTPTVAALTDVSSKADVTLGNLTAAGKAAMAHAAMPSRQYIEMSLPEHGGTVTAPADGWFVVQQQVSGNNVFFSMQTNVTRAAVPINTSGTIPVGITLPVQKGAVVNFLYNATIVTSTSNILVFVYANGSAPQP